MTILEEARHSLIIIEHDPMLYEDAQGMVEYVSLGLHDAAKEAAVLLYSPGTDTFLEDMTLMELEDRYSIRQKVRRLLGFTEITKLFLKGLLMKHCGLGC